MAWTKLGMGNGQGAASVRSVIGAEMTVTGNLAAQGDVQLDGEVMGDILCASLTLGASGKVRGNISVQHATLAGSVAGSVVATDLVIEKTARIDGDVAYESISIETGARVEGRLSQKGAPAGELKLVSAGHE